MRKLITLLISLTVLPVFAETFEVHCGFVDSIGQPYEFAKGFVDHIEVWQSIYKDYYMIVYHGKNNKYDIVIPYGKDKQALLNDFAENNQILYKDKNLFDRMIFKLRKNSYNHLSD